MELKPVRTGERRSQAPYEVAPEVVVTTDSRGYCATPICCSPSA